MEPIIESVKTSIDFNNDMPRVSHKVMRIISTKPVIRFCCSHCKSIFETNEWYRTKGRNYGASCPCCPYAAWSRG